MYLEFFESIALLVFAIGMIIGGGFTTYFGSGKSRAIGGIFAIIGVIALIFFIMLTGGYYVNSPWHSTLVWQGIVAVIGAIVGGAVALGIFLVGIMKA